MKQSVVGIFSALLLIVVAVPAAWAVEALSSDELISHCEYYESDPESIDGVFCVRYIQGFIDGAVATDERVTLNVEAEFAKEESFTERAMRTRLGSRLERFGPSYYAEFCLGEPVALKEVVTLVVRDLLNEEHVGDMALARNAVYKTLRNEYPCEADDAE